MSQNDSILQLEKRIAALEEENRCQRDLLDNFSAFVEEMPVGMVEYDLKSQKIIRHNKALRVFSGFSPEDFTAVSPLGLLTPESRELFEDRISRLLRGEEIPPTVEYQFQTKDGTVMWGLLTLKYLGENGLPTRILAVVQDITERKRVEEILQQGEARFRSIFENMQDCFYQTDIEGNVTWISPSTCNLIGYEPHEMVGESVADTFYVDAMERQGLLEELRAKGRVTGYEVRLRRKDGSAVWVSTNSQFYTDESGKVLGVEGVFRDITASKKAEDLLLQAHAELEDRVAKRTRELEEINRNLTEEIGKHRRTLEALNQSESKYRTMLESIEDGYYEVDLSGNLTFFNSALVRGLGYPATELLGMNYRDLTDEETAEKTNRIFHQIFLSGKPAKAEDHTLLKKDGTLIPLELSASLIRDENGQPTGFRGVVRDVSDRRAAEREKLDLEHRLQQAQKMEAVGTLAGGVAHDFNNLLMGLQGNVSLMLLDLGLEHPMAKRLRSIEEYIKDATGLTRQLLGFARGGKYEVKTSSLNLLVEKTLSMFGRTSKNIEVSTDLADTWAVDVDQGQIEQVLLNLYVNAWQAMPQGGSLTVTTQNVFLGETFTKPHESRPGRYVKLSVADSGVGMDEPTLQKVFDPFFTTKDVTRGTGLGLSSAYGIIKNHGGIINAASKPGQGAVFNVFLPASEGEMAEERPSPEGLEFGTETILLVDDEEIIVKTGKEILTALGYNAITVQRGKKAIELFQEIHHAVDLVILDVIMPDMNGGQVFERLRQINPGVKVLLSSGYSMDGQAAEIMARGCDAFIQKPFNLETLSQKLRQVLAKE